MNDRLQVYQDDDGLWWWKLKGKNGFTIAKSHQGYTSQQRVRGNLRQTIDLLVLFTNKRVE